MPSALFSLPTILADGENKTITENKTEVGNVIQIRSNTELSINSGVTVKSTGDDAIRAIAGGGAVDTIITNNGNISSSSNNAINLNGLGSNNITINNNGNITGPIVGEANRIMTLNLGPNSTINDVTTNDNDSTLNINGDGSLSSSLNRFRTVNFNSGNYVVDSGGKIFSNDDMDVNVSSGVTLTIKNGGAIYSGDDPSLFTINGSVFVTDGGFFGEAGAGATDRYEQITINSGGLLSMSGDTSVIAARDFGIQINSGGKLILNGGRIVLNFRELETVGSGEIELSADTSIDNESTGFVKMDSPGAILKIKLSSDSTAPKLFTIKDTDDSTFDGVNIKVDLNGKYVADNTNMIIYESLKGGGIVSAVGATVESLSPSVKYTLSTQNGRLILNARRVGSEKIFASSFSAAPHVIESTKVIESLAAENNKFARNFLEKVEGISDDDFLILAQSITPETNNASNTSVFQEAKAHLSSVFSHLGNLNHNQYTAGDDFIELVPWYQVSFSGGKKDEYKNVPGYHLNSKNITIGLDKRFPYKNTLGISFGLSDTKYKLSTKYINETNIDSYQLSLYHSFNYKNIYINNAFMTSDNFFKAKREELAPNLYNEYSSTYKGYQYSFKSEVEYPFGFEKVILIPVVGFQYFLSKKEGYGESVTDISPTALPKYYNGTRYEAALVKLGSSVIYKTYYKYNLVIKPSFNFYLTYDVINQKPSVTTNYINTSRTFTTFSNSTKKVSTFFGFNLDINRDDAWNLKLNLTHEQQRKYYNNSITARLSLVY